MLTLIDGNSLVFRAYYGMHANLTRSDGMPVGAVYGFFNMVLPLLSAAKPGDSFVCIFDASRISFRQDIYPLYKANRSETPADLLLQSELIRIGVHAMGVPVLCIPGVEADDVIATIANSNCGNPGGTRIITSDKEDCIQLPTIVVFVASNGHNLVGAGIFFIFGWNDVEIETSKIRSCGCNRLKLQHINFVRLGFKGVVV